MIGHGRTNGVAAAGADAEQTDLVLGDEGQSHQEVGRAADVFDAGSGRWSLDAPLSAADRDAIAHRTGTVHSYTLFTGYLPRRIRGELRSYQVLSSR